MAIKLLLSLIALSAVVSVTDAVTLERLLSRNERSTRCAAETAFCTNVVNDELHNWCSTVLPDLIQQYVQLREPSSPWPSPSGLLIYEDNRICYEQLNKVDQIWVHQCEQAAMLPWVARIVEDETGREDSMRSQFLYLESLVNNTVTVVDSYVPSLTECESYGLNAGCTIEDILDTTRRCVWDNSIAEERDVDYYRDVLDDLRQSGSKMQEAFQHFRLEDGTC
ncbi:uncharacterized protein LOC144344330 [Saccoglossus kowalevskii]